MPPEIDLSISIVTYKTIEKLVQLLESILNNIGNLTYEILIVDNENSDAVKALVQKYEHSFLVSNQTNLYFTRADNQNLSRARGKYILTINPDTVVIGDAFQKLIQFLEAHPAVGAVVPKVCYPDGSLQLSFAPFPTLCWGILEVTSINGRFPGNPINQRIMPAAMCYNPELPQPAEVLYGACIMIRREVLDKVGLKDESLVHGWDEYDWCRRIRNHGWKLYYVPDAKIIHFRGESKKQEQSQERIISYHWEGLFYLYQKHYGPLVGQLLRNLYRLRRWFGSVKKKFFR